MSIFPSVTEEQISAVKKLTREQRSQLYSAINNTDPRQLFQHVERGAENEIICPICGNGTGENHSGVIPTLKANGWVYGCRRPAAGGDCNFNGLLTSVIGKELNLNQKDSNDLCTILATGADFCGITVSPSDIDDTRRRQTHSQSQQRKEAGDKKEPKDYSRWYEFARKKLPDFIKECGGRWRGFTLKELQAFGVGFTVNDTGRRILIPYSSHHCFSRAVDKNTKNPKQHFGSKKLAVYNFDAISTEHVNFVVEGELDCLSIDVASHGNIHVAATGGAGDFEQLVARLNQEYASADVKPRIAVLFDNDDKGAGNVGQGKAVEAVAALMDNGFPAANFVLSETPNFDANDWFVKDRAELAARMKELEAEAVIKLDAAAAELKTRIEAGVREIQSEVEIAVQKLKSIEEATIQALPSGAESFQTYTGLMIQQLEAYTELTAPTPIFLKAVMEKFQEHAASTIRKLQKRAAAVIEVADKEKSDSSHDSADKPKDPLHFIKLEAVRNDFRKLQNSPETPARNSAMREIIRDWLTWSHDKVGNPTKVKAIFGNYRAVFDNDPVLKGLFGNDEFYRQVVFLKQAPWRKKNCVGELWNDTDDAFLDLYLREHYGELSHRELTPNFFKTYAEKNSFNVVQDWLNHLPAWDGKPRAETLFIDFLKVADDKDGYSREVTLNFLFGALARAYYPGCEYNYTPILQGEQGCGKSYILKKLGGRWCINLQDRIGSEKAIDAIQKAWICEIGELSASRKAENTELKNFLTEVVDTHRFAYDKRATQPARHVVFVGTCNDETPLSDHTGARRFVILKCGNRRNEFIEGLTPEYVQQVWSEALYKFRQLFPTDESFDAGKLLLSPKSIEIAAQLAEGATADDGLEGEVAAYLNKPIPAAPIWRLLTKFERCRFIAESRIIIPTDELKNRQAARRRPKEAAELKELLADMTPVEVKGFKGETDMVYKLYGDTYREHICASEIIAEMAGGRPDKRLTARRVNEVLSRLDGWTKGARIQTDHEYGDQRRVYYRTTPLEILEDDFEPPYNDDTEGDNDNGNNFDNRADDSAGNDFNDTSGENNNDSGGNDFDKTSKTADDSGGNDTGGRQGTEGESSEFDGYNPNERHNPPSGSIEEALLHCRYYYWQIKNDDNDDSNRRWFEYWKKELTDRREKQSSVA